MGRIIKEIRIGTYSDFMAKINKQNLIQIADNLYADTDGGMVYVISNQEWADYMTGKTDVLPVAEEYISDFDVDDAALMGVLFNKNPRDPNRIRKFCNQLADIWESQCPDWRFGQLFSNVMSTGNLKTLMPFYIEDDEMMDYFKKYFRLDEKRGEGNGSSKYQQR